MEDFKKEKPKHRVFRGSNTGPSSMVHDNVGDDIAENNNESSSDDDPASSFNDDQEESVTP